MLLQKVITLLVVVLVTVGPSTAASLGESNSREVPPAIWANPPKTLFFRETEPFFLICLGFGNPIPQYDWELNGKPYDPSGTDGRVTTTPGSGTLSFLRPLEKDEGTYQCFAKNKYGRAASYTATLHMAVLQSFPDGPVRRPRPDLGASLQLSCIPPMSIPPPHIVWSRVSDLERKPIILDQRVSIDPAGNLNFANVIHEDSISGDLYECGVWNDKIRRWQRGSYAQIFPRGDITRKHPLGPMWVAPRSQRALLGEEWRVKCIFSGNPTPTVTWKRTGGKPMPQVTIWESYGQELVIPNVVYDDAGTYECEGMNSEVVVPSVRAITLTVEAAPYWVTKPKSVKATEKDDVTIVCKADGKPEPAVAWFRDGKLISEGKEDPRLEIEGSTLTFRNVTLEDAMVFQCNVSNIHGYVFKNAFLIVE